MSPPAPPPERSHGHSCEAATARHAPLALWRIAQSFLTTLFNLFGAPGELAARENLPRATRASLRTWLRAGEALLRRLLLIEAANITLAPVRPRAPRTRKPRERKQHLPEHPENWRVSFRVFPLDLRRPRRQNASTIEAACRRDAGGPRDRWSPWPLAERCEALLRAYNNPAPYAARLARRLHAEPRRAITLMRWPNTAPEFAEARDIAALTDAAGAALTRYDSS